MLLDTTTARITLTQFRRTTQLQKLEDKLENIALVLSSTQGQDACRRVSPEVLHEFSPLQRDPELQGNNGLHQQPDTEDFHESGIAQRIHHQAFRSENTAQEHSYMDADALFHRYQRLMARYMPFVVISSETTASRLATTDPFLLKAITVVAHFHNTTKQQSMARDLMRDLAELLLIKGEKTLGILQGLLIFSYWYNPHLYFPQNHTNILHLTMALSTDLKLDRGGYCEKAQIENAAKAYGDAQPAETICNHGRRAILGTFYLTSLIFSSFRKVDVLSWTAWHTECAKVLEEAEEYESDKLVLQLARMQRIMQDTMAIEGYSTPIKLFADSFLDDLAKFRVLAGSAALGPTARLQEACTQIAIWQRSFAGLVSNKSDSHTLRQRLDGMWRCMESTKEFINIYMDLSIEDYPVIPFGVFAQFAYAFVVIIRALSLNLAGWDLPTLREYIDFSAIMEKAASRYEQVNGSQVDGTVLENEGFARWASKIRWAKAFYEAKIMAAASITQEMSSTEPGLEGLYSSTEAQLPSSCQPMDTLLDSFVNLEDFWNGFDMNSIQTTDFGFSVDGV